MTALPPPEPQPQPLPSRTSAQTRRWLAVVIILAAVLLVGWQVYAQAFLNAIGR